MFGFEYNLKSTLSQPERSFSCNLINFLTHISWCWSKHRVTFKISLRHHLVCADQPYRPQDATTNRFL